jgi:hypothetical protein
MWRVLRVDRLAMLHRVGRRGAILILIGAIWVVFGTTMLGDQIDRFSRPGPGGALQFLDMAWTGAMWLIGGAVAFVVGILHDRERVGTHDAVGFNALALPPMLFVFFYAWSAALNLVGPDGNPRAWLGMIIQTAVVTMLLIIAGWPEPPDSNPSPRRRGRS